MAASSPDSCCLSASSPGLPQHCQTEKADVMLKYHCILKSVTALYYESKIVMQIFGRNQIVFFVHVLVAISTHLCGCYYPSAQTCMDVPIPVPRPVWGYCYIQCSIHLIAKEGGGSLLVGSRALVMPPPPPQGV